MLLIQRIFEKYELIFIMTNKLIKNLLKDGKNKRMDILKHYNISLENIESMLK